MMSLRSWLRQRAPFLTGTLLPIGGIVLIVLGFWLPFGFRTTGLIEEWGINARLAQGWQILFVDVGSPMGAHAIRPMTYVPFAAAYALDPGSFLGYNLLHILILIGKGIFAFALAHGCTTWTSAGQMACTPKCASFHQQFRSSFAASHERPVHPCPRSPSSARAAPFSPRTCSETSSAFLSWPSRKSRCSTSTKTA
jgi:hypothetical protein